MTQQHSADGARFRRSLSLWLLVIAFLWLLHAADGYLVWDLAQFGVYPRRFDSLLGLLFAPLIHGSSAHLASNTPPLLVLGTALFYAYPRAAKPALSLLYLGSGFAVWLFAREAYHIGASGVTTGLMFFIFVIGILRRDPRAAAFSMLAFFLYGSMIWGIFPTAPRVSFESHLAGAAIGVILAIALRHRDPMPPRKKYSWELEDELRQETDISKPTFDADKASSVIDLDRFRQQ